MAGVFISHSSIDKPFVNRLAIDLVARGMPVWFDTWEIGTGDSLQQKIFDDGIETSDYVIVVLSPNSIASEWVQKELTAALTLEQRRGRTFVLPIRIADCEIPLTIGDRIYADFSTSYLEPLERLTSRLRELGLDGLSEPPDHALVPLVFEKGIYLDSVQLERRITALQPRLPNGFQFTFEQFIVAPDERYNELRQRLIYRKENIEDDPYYSPDFSRNFSQTYNSILDRERRLIEGIRLIVNAYIAAASPYFDVGVACHWFARDIRSQILYRLWSAQNPALPDSLDYGKDCDVAPFGGNQTAARFLEVATIFYIDIGPRDERFEGPFGGLANYAMIAIEDGSRAHRAITQEEFCSVRKVGSWDLYSKYLVPQLAARHVANQDSPFTVTFDDWYARIH